MTIFACQAWLTNGDLIADVARLHFRPEDSVLDATYGRGNWWTKYTPPDLHTNDLHTPADHRMDFRTLGFNSGAFDVVCFDPPYKLNGTPTLGDFDDRYGIGDQTGWRERMQLIVDGFIECQRVASRLVVAKVQDQVCSGKIRWQTLALVDHMAGFRLLDRFDMVGGGRPQPTGRRQVHAQMRPSTLMVFERVGPMFLEEA